MTKSPNILIRRVPLNWMVRSASLQKSIEVTYGLFQDCRTVGAVGLSDCRTQCRTVGHWQTPVAGGNTASCCRTAVGRCRNCRNCRTVGLSELSDCPNCRMVLVRQLLEGYRGLTQSQGSIASEPLHSSPSWCPSCWTRVGTRDLANQLDVGRALEGGNVVIQSQLYPVSKECQTA